MALIQYDWCPYEKGEDRGRDWSDASTNQGMLSTANKQPEARRAKEGFYPVDCKGSMALLKAGFQTSSLQT